jgi:hypothetical protein
VVQVEVHDHQDLLLRRLVESELDVLEDEVELLAARRLEAQRGRCRGDVGEM